MQWTQSIFEKISFCHWLRGYLKPTAKPWWTELLISPKNRFSRINQNSVIWSLLFYRKSRQILQNTRLIMLWDTFNLLWHKKIYYTSFIVSIVIPAATEMNNFSGLVLGLTCLMTSHMRWGFTLRKTISANLTTSSLSSVDLVPKS